MAPPVGHLKFFPATSEVNLPHDRLGRLPIQCPISFADIIGSNDKGLVQTFDRHVIAHIPAAEGGAHFFNAATLLQAIEDDSIYAVLEARTARCPKCDARIDAEMIEAMCLSVKLVPKRDRWKKLKIIGALFALAISTLLLLYGFGKAAHYLLVESTKVRFAIRELSHWGIMISVGTDLIILSSIVYYIIKQIEKYNSQTPLATFEVN